MKTIKKAFSLLLALAMVLSLSVTAFAANDGSITIDNATIGQTYTIYKVFDLTYSGENVSYTYTKTGNEDALYTALSADTSLFTLTPSIKENVYNVSLKDDSTSDEDIAEFLKNLVENNTLTTTIEGIQAESASVEFKNLAYGYYYVETTLGTSVTINSAMKDVTIKDKNEKPETDKKVKEDSTGDLGESNTADISDKVEYTTTITAKPGAENYVLHDTMTEGLTFNDDIAVKVGGTPLTAYTESATTWDYKIVTSTTDNCTFEIAFNQDYLDTIKEDTTITVTYTANVNDKAVIDGDESDNNINKTYLSYGENNDIQTTEKATTTYVFDVDILKYTTKDSTEVALPDAQFILYKTVNEVKQCAKVESGKLTGWTATESEASTLTTDAEGKISVDGLDADTYYLEETEAPAGYNLLTAPVQFKIDDEGNVMVLGEDNQFVDTNDDIVKIENKTGTPLPSTGGIGTTIFYVVGSVLVLGAAVLLIMKKRGRGTQES